MLVRVTRWRKVFSKQSRPLRQIKALMKVRAFSFSVFQNDFVFHILESDLQPVRQI
jgi:hypothetical protein